MLCACTKKLKRASRPAQAEATSDSPGLGSKKPGAPRNWKLRKSFPQVLHGSMTGSACTKAAQCCLRSSVGSSGYQ